MTGESLLTTLGKKYDSLVLSNIFLDVHPYVFPDGLKPPTSPMIVPPEKAGVFQFVAVQLRVSQHPLRCTRAGTPDNSADVDYDHFPEEVHWKMCILHTDIVSLFCTLSIFIMIFCEWNSGLRSLEKIRIQWIFPYLLI